jgi:GNAT superfamily N-acetyltransferase
MRDLKDKVRSVEKITLTAAFGKTVGLIYENRTYLLYHLLARGVENNNAEDSQISVQKYADLLGYTGSNLGIRRDDLYSEALKRFSAEDRLYSVTKDGILVHYGWMSKITKDHRFAEVDLAFDSGLDGVRLYDFYTEPALRRQGLFQRTLGKMILDAREMGAREMYIAIHHDNLAAKRAIEQMGFSLLRTFSRKRFLWMCKSKELTHA